MVMSVPMIMAGQNPILSLTAPGFCRKAIESASGQRPTRRLLGVVNLGVILRDTDSTVVLIVANIKSRLGALCVSNMRDVYESR